MLELRLAQPFDVEEVGEVERVEAGRRVREARRLARSGVRNGMAFIGFLIAMETPVVREACEVNGKREQGAVAII